MPLSTNAKIAVAVGVTAAILLVGLAATAAPAKSAAPPPRPKGINFKTRNVDALNAIVEAIVSDPNASSSGIAQLADQLDYFGLYAQALRLREKINPALRMSLATPSYGGSGGGAMSFRQAAAQAK